jgi:hypothetical protein
VNHKSSLDAQVKNSDAEECRPYPLRMRHKSEGNGLASDRSAFHTVAMLLFEAYNCVAHERRPGCNNHNQ